MSIQPLSDKAETVRISLTRGVATIALNRPEALNAFTPDMGIALANLMHRAHLDPDVRIIVLTGEGRGFCAGGDFKVLGEIQKRGGYQNTPQGPEAETFKSALGPDVAGHFGGRFGYFMSVQKPIVAAINGPAAGLGLVIALYADMRIMAQGAKVTSSFAERGLIAEHGLGWLLPRLVGPSRALDLLFTSRRLGADEAVALGLANAVMPDEGFHGRVIEWAADLAARTSPRSLAVMKRQVWKSYFQDFDASLALANDEMFKSFATPDFKEGVAHFLEKRPAKFPPI